MLKELIKKASELNSDEKQRFLKWLNKHLEKVSEKDTELAVIEIRKQNIATTGVHCPHCKSAEIIGYGSYRERKRYQCKSCSKTLNELSGTAIHKIHLKHKWNAYIDCMIQGMTLREAASKVGINLRTSFAWRHKILSSLNEVGCTRMEGIVEADETFFLFSEKGTKTLSRKPRKRGGKASRDGMNKEHVNVIVAADRKGNRAMNVGNRGVITKKAVEKSIGKWINKEASILVSDAHVTFQAYAKENRLPHKMLYARKKQHVVDHHYHIQHVNNIHGQLKKFIDSFNGVATKYLQNYVNYFKVFTKLKKKAIITAMMENVDVYYGTMKTNLQYDTT